MEQFYFKKHSYRRLNILTGEWILVSPHRAKKPWQGKMETVPANNRTQYDENVIYADVSKSKDILGWQTEKGIEEMVIDAWRWEQKLKSNTDK